jgi:hypothetical protein
MAGPPRVHVRRWLRGIVSRHSPTRPPSQANGEPLLISAAWDEGSTAAAPATDLPLASLETLSKPWARQSIEGWYRAHGEPGGGGGSGGGNLAPVAGAEAPPPPPMGEERFLTFGKQATSLSELELLDLLDLFDRDSAGEIGFEEFIVVLGFLLAVETRAFAPFITEHIAALHEMLSRPGSAGPTPTAAIQLGVLAGLAGRAVEQSLAQLQLPLSAPIASQGDFGRLLFATLGAIKPEAGARATKSSRGAATATAAGPDDDGMATLGMGRAKGHRRRGLGGMCGACACGQRRRRAYDA